MKLADQVTMSLLQIQSEGVVMRVSAPDMYLGIHHHS